MSSREREALRALVGTLPRCHDCRAPATRQWPDRTHAYCDRHKVMMSGSVLSDIGEMRYAAPLRGALAILAEPAPPEPREPEAESLMARVVAAYEDWDETPAFGEAIEVSRAIDAMRAYLKGQREARTGPPMDTPTRREPLIVSVPSTLRLVHEQVRRERGEDR